MIDTTHLRELTRAVSIIDVAKHLGITRQMREVCSGRRRYFVGRCFFCRVDHEHKFYLYDNRHRYNGRPKDPGEPSDPDWFRCYRGSCQVHGDVVELVRQYCNLNFGQAVAWLCHHTGISLSHLQEDHHARRTVTP